MTADPDRHLGDTVTLRGTAHNARAGAVVVLPDGAPIYVSGLMEWAEDVVGRSVDVTGRLSRRPSRLPQVDPGGDQYHGIGDSFALDDASWVVQASGS